jgi:hypothetical protein
MRSFLASLLALVALLVTSRFARADEPAKTKGYVVVATDGATDAAWPLAGAIYSSELLKPKGIDDARARVLAGEPAPDDAAMCELAELRAGVKGDDAASRQVLSALADKLQVSGVVVVLSGDPPVARLFDATTKAFEAARYSPDKGDWKPVVRALEQPFLPAAPPLVTRIEAGSPGKPTQKSKAFYESPWFWVAIGAALLIGGGVLIATNVQTSDTLRMQVKLP